MSQSFDVMVVGGGIVGLSAAIAMSQRGFSVAIMDAGSLSFEEELINDINSRVYAINQASQSLFEALGVWKNIEQSRTSPYLHMHVWDAANGAHIDFDARMAGTDRLGTIIKESVIKVALIKQLEEQEVRTFPLSRLSAVVKVADKICIRDTKGQDWDVNLLIVADGAASPTRGLLGVDLTTWSYHQEAIVATIRTELPHHSTAYQVFNPNGPLAFLPLADPHQCSIVWSTTPDDVMALMKMDDDNFADKLKEAFASKLGICSVIGKRYQFPLRMRHAKSYSGPGWLLMGDAAHTIHPLAGLGLNVGLADLAAWLAHLGPHKEQPWTNKTLKAYQRQRKAEVWQIIALMQGLKTIFAHKLAPITALRGLGLNTFNALAPLKRWLIAQASNQ